ncbi:MAG: PLP-dependent aminotransferase family protein [Candidatus Obscuribacterales bacterium]
MNWQELIGVLKAEKPRGVPMYAELARILKESIETGKLTAGEKLPTDRSLASSLQVDRSTVSRAYDELQALGLISSHVGRGTFVTAAPINLNPDDSPSEARRSRRPSASPLPASSTRSVLWHEKFSRFSQASANILNRQPVPYAAPESMISFSGGTPTREFIPHEDFQNMVGDLVRKTDASDMFEYSPPDGHPLLREQVRAYLKRNGIEAAEDELLILSGSQQGIDLVGRTFVDANDAVALEDPTYFWALCNFSSLGARCLPVSVDENGLRLDVLESVISRQRVKLAYVMPSFQNPTGASMPIENRRQLLELAGIYNVPILEDNFVGDLSYDGAPFPTLKALDEQGVVIHQGTFSKALCPGLRLGWLVAPREVISRLLLAKRTIDLSTNSMAQVIVARYLNNGLYEKHLDIVRRAYRSRRDTMDQALRASMPNDVTWTKPQGGMFIWAKLPSGASAREMLALAESEGVTYSPGDMFFFAADRPEYFRLTFIQQNEQQIEQGIARLSRAVKKYLATRSSVASRAASQAHRTLI